MEDKWARQSQVAARTIRMNEILKATDVTVQRKSRSCLGTADALAANAVRLVLTGEHEIGRKYFEAVRDLSEAAVADGETWVFSDVFFAKCEALRLRAFATWALGVDDSTAVAAALEAWEDLAETELCFNPAKRNAHTSLGLLAAHVRDWVRASISVTCISECDRKRPWCNLAMLMQQLNSSGRDHWKGWDSLFGTFVVSDTHDELVGDAFSVVEACMIANVRASLHDWRLEPFEVVGLLRGKGRIDLMS